MRNKSHLLIIGPIGDIGGRELETGFIAHTLNEEFVVKVLSTSHLTSNSQIFDFISKREVKSLDALIFKNSMWYRFLALISYYKSSRSRSILQFVNNSLSKKTGYRDFALKQIKLEIDKSDAVVICAQISSNYIKEVVEYSSLKKKPLILRTSNTIKKTDKNHSDWIEKVDLFIHHSLSNANRLSFINNYKFKIIDQCVFKEVEMLNLPPVKELKSLLFVGRLSNEKGVIEVLKFFRDNDLGVNLKIIGDGELNDEVRDLTRESNNLEFMGFLDQKAIINEIKKGDAFIIPSYEESGPLVGLEAMASARLVLATKVGAMEERLKGCENQFWFDINNLNSLKNLIKDLNELDSIDVQRIALQNRNRYIENYRAEVIKSQYKNAIFSLINLTKKENI